MKQLANTLSLLCSQKGLTLDELSIQTTLSKEMISNILNGASVMPAISDLIILADFFELTLDQLVGRHVSNKDILLKCNELHDISNKLATVRSTGSSLMEIIPILESAYKTALRQNLIQEDLPIEIFPLIQTNVNNLILAANHIANILKLNKRDAL